MNIIDNSSSYDFANILFSGKCNAGCPYCIGQRLTEKYPSNLDTYPLPWVVSLISMVKEYSIPEIIFTGTTTDPLLYRHQKELQEYIHNEVPSVRRAIHTNGFLILKRLEEFHGYTKCTLSIPSFQKKIFRIMMWTVQSVPDITAIMQVSNIPIKVSRIVDETNNTLEDTHHYLETCSRIGVKRVVFRKLFGDLSSWDYTKSFIETCWGSILWEYRWNPVYVIWDMEITLWSFDNTQSKSINLFSDGAISDEYLLEKNTPSI